MGLTIHFSLRSAKRNISAVRGQLCDAAHHAQRLPLESVGLATSIDEAVIQKTVAGASPMAFRQQQHKTTAEALIAIYTGSIRREQPKIYQEFFPLGLAWVKIDTLPGCEDFELALAQCPAKVAVEYERQSTDPRFRHRRWAKERATKTIPTGLGAWSGSGFCKTGYAANDHYGGLVNFLTCHLAVIKVLEECQRSGLAVDVDDESGFWDTRDLVQLAIYVAAEHEQLTQGMLKQLRNRFTRYGLVNVPELDETNFTTIPDYDSLMLAYNFRERPQPQIVQGRAHARIKIRGADGGGSPGDTPEVS